LPYVGYSGGLGGGERVGVGVWVFLGGGGGSS